MRRFWLVCVTAVVAVAVGFVSGRVGTVGAQEKAAGGDKVAAWKKAFAASKTSLSQAITNAEKESKGKAYDASAHLAKDGKLHIDVGVLVGDKLMAAPVDPDTGKVGKIEEDKEAGVVDEDE